MPIEPPGVAQFWKGEYGAPGFAEKLYSGTPPPGSAESQSSCTNFDGAAGAGAGAPSASTRLDSSTSDTAAPRSLLNFQRPLCMLISCLFDCDLKGVGFRS